MPFPGWCSSGMVRLIEVIARQGIDITGPAGLIDIHTIAGVLTRPHPIAAGEKVEDFAAGGGL